VSDGSESLELLHGPRDPASQIDDLQADLRRAVTLLESVQCELADPHIPRMLTELAKDDPVLMVRGRMFGPMGVTGQYWGTGPRSDLNATGDESEYFPTSARADVRSSDVSVRVISTSLVLEYVKLMPHCKKRQQKIYLVLMPIQYNRYKYQNI
jgi:hypothetical protein